MAIPYPQFIVSEKSPMEAKIVVPSSPSSASQASPSPPPPPPSSMSSVVLTQDELKKIAAYKAVEYVESNMVIGLGTGSTAKHAVDRIAELLNQGRGGSLLREKMVESSSKKFVVIVDESKKVEHLGGSGLAMPVEVVPYGDLAVAKSLQALFEDSGCVAKRRTLDLDGKVPFVTDNGNHIVELFFKKDIGDLNTASDKILRIPGVVEHGMFLGLATTVIVAGELGVRVENKS
ncbi:hypothetical protein ACJW31_08G171800 [Castanea mollissima]